MDANTSLFNCLIKDHKYCNLGVEETNIWGSAGGGNKECGLSIFSRFRKHLKLKTQRQAFKKSTTKALAPEQIQWSFLDARILLDFLAEYKQLNPGKIREGATFHFFHIILLYQFSNSRKK